MPDTSGIRPHALTYITPVVGGVVGFCAGFYSASNTRAVPSGKPELDAEAMIRATVGTVVEHIRSSDDAKVSTVDDEVNNAAAKILDIVSDVMASHIRSSNAAKVSGYIDPAITSKVEEAPIKKEMELVNHSDTQKQIEAGKPYAEFIHEFGIYSIEAQLALKMKIAEVQINRGVSCEKVCRELNISGEARLKLEMMIVELPRTLELLNKGAYCDRLSTDLGLRMPKAQLALELLAVSLPRTREMIQDEWPYQSIIRELDIYFNEAKSELKMMVDEWYKTKTRNTEAAISRSLELWVEYQPVAAAIKSVVEDDSVISPNQHIAYYHKLNEKLVKSKISEYFYHTKQPHFYQFLMCFFSPRGQLTFINPKTLSNIDSIDIFRITNEKLFIRANYHSVSGEAFGQLINFNEFQQAVLAEINGFTRQEGVIAKLEKFSLIEKQKQLKQFITDKITELTPQNGAWIEINDTAQLNNLIELTAAAPRILGTWMLAGYGKTVNLPNLDGRKIYVRRTFPSQSEFKFKWYQLKVGKNAEDKHTENHSLVFNFRALEAHLRKKEVLEKHSDNGNYVKQSEKSLKPGRTTIKENLLRPNQPENEQKAKGEYTNEVRSTLKMMVEKAQSTLKMMVEKAQIISKSVLNKINNVSHQQFKELSAFINAVDKNGLTPLQVATQNGHSKVADYLMRVGASYYTDDKFNEINNAELSVFINAVDKNGRTELYLAAHRGRLELVQYLVAAGADVNIADVNGLTPLGE
ncbi:ankyrin repeat domain-containing protein [Candidatus Regiella insecticola]|uniref:ankyrin repeat domain-containing protein n=1 Tax=Candidatus Regiella insecticola TaxID=138073 RepID=UPI0015971345|nr:ankyrin repeat domain-containing protein [Candidatus Regiella insecticola]